MIEKNNTFPFYPFVIIWLISASLMLALALYNNGAANDNHRQVAEMIVAENYIPKPTDCWQCYHPKLYHQTVAKLWTYFEISDNYKRITVSQIINGFAGILTLTLILNFILKQPFSKITQLICFALIALNPKFISIHAHPSNDAFIILFGSLVIYAIYKRYFWLMLLATILAGLSKGNSSVLILGVTIVYFLKIISQSTYSLPFSQNPLKQLPVFLIIVISCIWNFGPYARNLELYGKAFKYNTELSGIPHLWKKEVVMRSGVQSILDGYGTFRLWNMLETPIITDGKENYPKHRTSVWSQLYGRTHFVYFENWPWGFWQSKLENRNIMNVGRIALVLGLIPTFLFFIGMFQNMKSWFSFFKNRNLIFFQKNKDWVLDIFFFGFLGFIITFTAQGRDFSFMKVIYLMPGILTIIIPLLKGIEFSFSFFEKNKTFKILFLSSLSILLVCYVIPLLDILRKMTAHLFS